MIFTSRLSNDLFWMYVRAMGINIIFTAITDFQLNLESPKDIGFIVIQNPQIPSYLYNPIFRT